MEYKTVEKGPTLVDTIMEQFKELIINGYLEIGDKLPSERELAIKFSVSRATVREVLKGLLGIGIIIQNKEGTFVNRDISTLFTNHLNQRLILDRIDIKELFEVRKVLEIQNVAYACERASREDIDNISIKLKRNIESLNDKQKFNYSDIAFHEAVAFAAQNRVLFELFTAVRHLVWEANKASTNPDSLIKSSAEFHKKIYEAIVERDIEKGKKVMLEHIEYGESLRIKPIT